MPLCFTFFLTPAASLAHIPQSHRSPRYSTSPFGLRLEPSSTAPTGKPEAPTKRWPRQTESGLR